MKDLKEAAKWYRKAADQDYAEAQYNLGVFYRHGEGVEKDHVEAVKWFRKAAEQGDAKAQHVVGNCYAEGDGVVKDKVEAYKWHLLAGARGDKHARQLVTLSEKELTTEQRNEGEKRAKEWEAQFKAKAGK